MQLAVEEVHMVVLKEMVVTAVAVLDPIVVLITQ
jgi:hypothetical protein